VSDRPAVRLTVPAEAEQVAVVRRALAGAGDALGIDPTIVADMKTAATEACANVVRHAYPDGPNGEIEIEVEHDDARVVVVVRDEGGGIKPRIEPQETALGLGLPLMAALSDEFELRHGPSGGTEVRLAFLRERARRDGS
jgi:serine/threonine-protein kinase RsbW